MLPPTRSGMTEASTTRSRSIEDAQLAVDHRSLTRGFAPAPHNLTADQRV
jgi:hypothetical protein